ncbi:MAG: glycoside hydrolase family 65 protein [Anaerolineae bacterium]|nr:glycoside hydrolase family 65 protein [Anaerolineae bacterium]
MNSSWEIVVNGFDREKMNHTETILTIGNGYLCTRGSFAEKMEGQNVATFMHGVYDDIPVSFTELANIPNWTALQIEFGDESFRITEGKLHNMEQRLDMHAGVLSRTVDFETSSGKRAIIRFSRFASMAQRYLCAQKLEIQPINFSGTVKVVASFDGQADNLGLIHWNVCGQVVEANRAILHVKTRKTNVDVAMGMILGTDPEATIEQWNLEGHPSLCVVQDVSPERVFVLTKKVNIVTSRDSTDPVLSVNQMIGDCSGQSWEELLTSSVAVWERLWHDCDIEIDSEDDAQLIARFSIYHLLIAAPYSDEQVSIGAKTLSGYGYRGHVFWDTEIFMLPFFSFVLPDVASNLLSYRYHRLAGARKKAQLNGFDGAQFPWESAGTGEEVTPTWVPHFADPTKLVRIWTGDIQIHITADIAYALHMYWKVTGDDAFMAKRGLPIILEGAQFWVSRLEWNATESRYEIRDVIGPDENHDHVDNNTFTNFMAQWHIRLAISMAQWMAVYDHEGWKRLSARLNINEQLLTSWSEKADMIYIPQALPNGVIEQCSGFFEMEQVDLSHYAGRTRSIQEIFGIEEAAKIQVLKQADIVMLMYLFRELFPKDVIQANYDYYSPKTDHEFGSSLGPAMHSLVASWIGRKEEAYEHFMRAGQADLFDIRGNVGDGIHAASIGGIWQTIVFGFAGLIIDEIGWNVHPKLPGHWKRISFHFYYQGQRQHVEVTQEGGTDD